MSGFTKLVPEIVLSSVWNEPEGVRCVWIAMLATKDENGYVRGDARTIARISNVSLETAELALATFQQKDPTSHTPDNDGRRIMPAAGGWIVLNHELYRSRDDEYRAKTRERVRRCRAKMAGSEDDVTLHETLPKRYSSASASSSASSSTSEGKGSGEGETNLPVAAGAPPDKWTLAECITAAEGLAMPRRMVEEFWAHYAAVGFVDAAGRELKNLKAALAKWKTKQEAGPMMRGGGRQASGMDLERSITAARAELAAMPAKDEPSFPGDAARTPEQRERAGVLKARIREWQRQMAGG